jgi:hypothetical protein
MDDQLRSGEFGPDFERDRAAFEYLFEWFDRKIHRNFGEMRDNADDSMRDAAEAARAHNDTLPNDAFYIHEGSPLGRDAGKELPAEHIPQFDGEGEDPRKVDREPGDTYDLDVDEVVDDATEPVDRGDGAPEEPTPASSSEDS